MIANVVGRSMIATGFFILLSLFSLEMFAADTSIVEVRRNIPLSDSEPTYKDFYIFMEAAGALKENTVVTAFRSQALKDATGTQNLGELKIPVGRLKIIAVQNRLAVAREIELLSRDALPMLEQRGLMIGDRIDIASAKAAK